MVEREDVAMEVGGIGRGGRAGARRSQGQAGAWRSRVVLAALLAGCGGDPDSRGIVTCDPESPNACGPGWWCQPVAGKDFKGVCVEEGSFHDVPDIYFPPDPASVDPGPVDAGPGYNGPESIGPFDPGRDDCTPNCSDKECGDDGCGGSCGTCSGGKVCQDGLCVCAANSYVECCGNAVCWFDSCGNQGTKIADCPHGCSDGVCVLCVPKCGGKECGDDGCGGSCGTCSGGKVCQDGLCVCAANSYKACCGNAVCWFDSCGNQGAKIADCPYGCSDGVCEPAGNVDLTITHLLAPKGADNNKPFNISVTIKNQGTAAAGSFTVKAYFSSDTTPGGPGDQLLHNWPVPSLGPDASQTLSAQVSFSGFPIHAYYHIVVKVDADDQITETNENNNIAIQQVFVSR